MAAIHKGMIDIDRKRHHPSIGTGDGLSGSHQGMRTALTDPIRGIGHRREVEPRNRTQMYNIVFSGGKNGLFDAIRVSRTRIFLDQTFGLGSKFIEINLIGDTYRTKVARG